MGDDFDEAKHLKKPRKRLSKLDKDSKYPTTCKAGMGKPVRDSKKRWQAHHVLSITCMTDARRRKGYPAGADVRKYIDDCLAATEWNINDEPNLLGMPLNFHHRTTDGIQPYPSHQADHNTADGYTKEVSDWMQENVWSTLQAKKQIHKVDVKTIKTELENTSKHFRGLLMDTHPMRDLGTHESWKQRFQRLNSWFKPFSMATVPLPRKPGKSPTNFTDLFRRIK
jgi:hypothetical protein